MRKRFLPTAALVFVLALALLGCGLLGRDAAQISPMTPTKTLRPLFTSTFTPAPSPLPTDTVPPTATEVPASDTPPPTSTPQPTDTATVETAPTEAVPSETPLPPTEAAPSDTPRPQSTDTPVPPTDTPRPQFDYRVVEQRLWSKAENEAQRHMILIRVIDAGGQPLAGLIVWDPSHTGQEAETGTKPEPYHAEYTFWNYDGYQLEVKGANSEKTKVLSTDVYKIPIEDLVAAGYCSEASSCNPSELVQHYSWYVTFQRTW